jgi:hypothetical protein
MIKPDRFEADGNHLEVVMRKFQILLFGLAVSQIAPAHAQDPAGELMLEAYQQSIANANFFDEWVSRNASRFDARFLSCLSNKISGSTVCAQRWEALCQQYPSYQLQADCRSKNQCSQIGIWSMSLLQKLSGTPWLQTPEGQLLNQSASMCNLAPALCQSILVESLCASEQLFRGLLAC